jgi:hypothetical protein
VQGTLVAWNVSVYLSIYAAVQGASWHGMCLSVCISICMSVCLIYLCCSARRPRGMECVCLSNLSMLRCKAPSWHTQIDG